MWLFCPSFHLSTYQSQACLDHKSKDNESNALKLVLLDQMPQLCYKVNNYVNTGIGLMEIITAPDFNSGEEALSFVKELQSILKTIGVSTANMSGMYMKYY